MTDRYVFNPDIRDEQSRPAHRCGNCRHHERDAARAAHLADGGGEAVRCWCNHDGRRFITGDDNHCCSWEEEQ